jgi:hypothetical protein
MAVAFVQEFTIEGDDRSTTNYDRINERLAHDRPAPEGLLIHYAGFDDDAGVFRIVNVWETEEQGQAYHDEQVVPAVRELIPEGSGAPPARQTTYELYHVAKP